MSDSLRHKLDTYKAGLPVGTTLSGADSYYDNFDWEFRNFWTNSSYYCILGGMGWMPDVLPRIRYGSAEALREAEEKFRAIKRQSLELAEKLPSNHEFLQQLHGRTPQRRGSQRVGG